MELHDHFTCHTLSNKNLDTYTEMYTSKLNFYIAKIDMERKQVLGLGLKNAKTLEVQGHCNYKR